MKKNIWIMNHYATNSFYNEGGRHHWFAKNLNSMGRTSTIFCANTRHNSKEIIDTGNDDFSTKKTDGVPYVFVKTTPYKGNGLSRIKNMYSFYKNLFSVARDYAEIHGKPDVILASSVHPLTLVAGIKIAKKYRIPCICEVRDLWPETLVAYGSLNKSSIITKLLYLGEKWIYKKANKLVFTMEGGKDYIIEQGWSKEQGGPVDLSKVHHINNGVDLEMFDYNRRTYTIDDVDLNNSDCFKVIYTGSIRKVNNVRRIVEVAEILEKKGYPNIKLLIYGKGTEKEKLEKYCQDNNIQNVVFKGFVDKNKIPYILSKSNLNIMHFQQSSLKKYGASLNKMFEYFASGKPTISDCEFGYDIIKKYKCGVVLDNASPEQLGEAIIKVYLDTDKEYELYCANAFKTARDYDFKKLTLDLIDVIEK